MISAAVLLGLGVTVFLAGALGAAYHLYWGPDTTTAAPPSTIGRRLGQWRASITGADLLRAGAGAVAGLVLAALTGWIVLIPACVVFAGIFPRLFSTAAEIGEVDRLEAMRSWTRSLAGMVSTGTSLEHAVASSLSNTPEPIYRDVARLVARLETGWRTPDAVSAFAEDLDHPTGDLIATHLIMAARQRGPGLATALEDLAESVFDEVKMHRSIITDRAKPRLNARIVMVVTAGVLVLLPFADQFSAPYRTPLGQVLYGAWVAVFLMILWVMHRQLLPKPPTRLMGRGTEAGRR